MSGSAITVEGVSKRYVKYNDTPLLLQSVFRAHNRGNREELWALKNASFSVEPGESVGVIGRNGSGKSTLLRLLAGVSAPTRGSVRVRGRIAPLIAVGVGFHPELTGRENVFVNGAILGVTRRDIERRFDEIVDFAEIEDFIDTPVKFYSSGMYVRLGFAASVLAEPDVLLVDEVLAVGDIAFQLKCFDRMKALQERGTTIVVVSHNLAAVRNVCPRTLVIHDSELRFDGPTSDAVSLYHDLLSEGASDTGQLGPEGAPATLLSFDLRDASDQPVRHVDTGAELVLAMRARFNKDVHDPLVNVRVHDERGVCVYTETTPWTQSSTFAAGTTVELRASVTAQLVTGSYTAQMVLADRRGKPPKPLCALAGPELFYVAGRPLVRGVVDMTARFSTQLSTDHDLPQAHSAVPSALEDDLAVELAAGHDRNHPEHHGTDNSSLAGGSLQAPRIPPR